MDRMATFDPIIIKGLACLEEMRSRYNAEITVTDEMLDRFTYLSCDENQLHTDKLYARSKGYRDRLLHGALVTSLASSIVGCICSDIKGIVSSQRSRHISPAYPGEAIRISLIGLEYQKVGESIKVDLDVTSSSIESRLIASCSWILKPLG